MNVVAEYQPHCHEIGRIPPELANLVCVRGAGGLAWRGGSVHVYELCENLNPNSQVLYRNPQGEALIRLETPEIHRVRPYSGLKHPKPIGCRVYLR